MKHKNYLKGLIFTLLSTFPLAGCESFLEEEVFTQYDPETFLKDQQGVDALLTGAYSAQQITVLGRDYYNILGDFPTDMAFESDGGLERDVLPVQRFTMTPSMAFISGQYNKFYDAIARANNVLRVVSDLKTIDKETIDKINGEARFIRGFSYYILHNLFGPTPIIEIPKGASLDEIERIGKETPKATEDEYRAYVEADFLFAATTLKAGGISSRANKGNAYAMLTKFYLNTKQWQKAADAAAQVIGIGGYVLNPDFVAMFTVEGERANKEYILVGECKPGTVQYNQTMAHNFPQLYRVQSNWTNFGAQFRFYTSYFETFEEQDIRRSVFITEYIPSNSTKPTPLVRDAAGKALDNVRSFKYRPDPNAINTQHGNDMPYVRLADIILARAEALNEMNGPSQESVTLINQIRNRAKATPITLAAYPTKDGLRDFILAERAREFFDEGLRREDLIRHGKFIERAVARGWPAKPFHVLYPLPQVQVDNNPNLKQNAGY